MINGSDNYRPPVIPFGGVKLSGIGREGLGYTLEELSREKTIIFRRFRDATGRGRPPWVRTTRSRRSFGTKILRELRQRGDDRAPCQADLVRATGLSKSSMHNLLSRSRLNASSVRDAGSAIRTRTGPDHPRRSRVGSDSG